MPALFFPPAPHGPYGARTPVVRLVRAVRPVPYGYVAYGAADYDVKIPYGAANALGIARKAKVSQLPGIIAGLVELQIAAATAGNNTKAKRFGEWANEVRAMLTAAGGSGTNRAEPGGYVDTGTSSSRPPPISDTPSLPGPTEPATSGILPEGAGMWVAAAALLAALGGGAYYVTTRRTNGRRRNGARRVRRHRHNPRCACR